MAGEGGGANSDVRTEHHGCRINKTKSELACYSENVPISRQLKGAALYKVAAGLQEDTRKVQVSFWARSPSDRAKRMVFRANSTI